MPRKLSQLSLRDLLLVGLPILIAVAAAFWGASRFIKPAPPDKLVISSGGESGAYLRFAMRYRDVLARYDIDLEVRRSSGSMENLERLREPSGEVEAGFIQGGTARPGPEDALESLGDFYHEPLWVFYRASFSGGRPLDRLTDLKGGQSMMESGNVLATNGALHTPIQALISGH